MAMKILQTVDGPMKLQLDEESYNKMTDEEKKELELAEEKGYVVDAKDFVGKVDDGVIQKYDKIEVTGGDALTTEIEKEEQKKPEKKESGFKTFVKGVGEAFSNIAEGAEKKLETVYDDKEKRMMFLSGLNTIIDASSFTPITQAKSPLGIIAGGQKKGFLESEAISTKRKELEAKKLQALRQPKRVADPEDKVIAEMYKDYNKKYNEGKASRIASERSYTELLKNKNYTPTGILENFFLPLNEIAVQLGYGDFINDMRKKYADNPDHVPSEEDIVKFKSIIDADSGSRILGKAKELYPVSNVDLQLLLKGAGSLSTNPEALKVLLSAERTLNLIEDEAYPLAMKFAYPGGQTTGIVNFQAEATDMAAKNLAKKFDKEVTDETLIELFGTKERNDFRVINAKLYQDLKVDKTIPNMSAFDIFIKAKKEKESEIEDIKSKYKKKDT